MTRLEVADEDPNASAVAVLPGDDVVAATVAPGRREALRTLDKLGQAKRADRAGFYMLDLKASACATRRRAVTKLAVYGDKRAIPALQAADKKDEDETPWYKPTCLGDDPAEAVAAIRARR